MSQNWQVATNIAERIKDVRNNVFRMTQAEFGNEVFRSSGSVSDWERGKTVPDPLFLSQLARKLNTSVEMFTDDGPMPSSVVNEAVYAPASPELHHFDQVALRAVAALTGGISAAARILATLPNEVFLEAAAALDAASTQSDTDNGGPDDRKRGGE